MTRVQTSADVLRALREAASYRPTSEELHKQRVSYIYGILNYNSNVTRARIEEVLAEQEGETHEPVRVDKK